MQTLWLKARAWPAAWRLAAVALAGLSALLLCRMIDGKPSFSPPRLHSNRASQVSCPGGLLAWPMNLSQHETRVYSQTNQDGVLTEIFSQLGTTNKYFVEFGFDSNSFEEGGGGANTRNLWAAGGWQGLLLDGGHENASINLHKEFIHTETIVQLFDKYAVPKEPDYVSVDLDSCDVWVFLALTKEYRPRVISMEYNMNFPAGSTIAMPPDCNVRWAGDRMMGASLATVFEAARDAGYTVIHAIPLTDAFLVRNDLAECLNVLPQWVHEQRVTGKPLHGVVKDKRRLGMLVDYVTYRDSGGNLTLARKRASEVLPYAPLLQE